MHHPGLSLTGRKPGRKKWASAEQKARAMAAKADWENMKTKFGINGQKLVKTGALKVTADTGRRAVRVSAASSDPTTWQTCARPEDKVYTGTALKGIATSHKSNLLPVFSDDHAVEISKMRRG